MLRKHWLLLVIILLLQSAFTLFQLHRQNFFLDDSAEYIMAADNLLTDGTLYCGDLDEETDPALYTKRTPGYPAFLAAIRWFGSSQIPVVLIQSLLSLVSILLMIHVFLRENKRAIWAAFLLFFLPSQFIYANLVMAEILFQLVLMLMIWMAWLYFRTRRRKFMWTYQLLLVAAILVKPVMYLFVFPNILLFGYLYARYRRRLDLISCLIPLVFVILFASINQQRTGHFHVSSIQQINLINYNIYYFTLGTHGKDTADMINDAIYAHCAGHEDYAEYADCLISEAKTILKKDIFGYAVFHAKGMLRFFIDPGRFDLYNFMGIEPEGGKGFLYRLNNEGFRGALKYLFSQPVHLVAWMMLIALLNVLKTVGFAFYLFNRQVRPEFRLLLFLLVGTLAFATGPLGASRFALPVALIIVGSSVFQYTHWYMWLKKKKTGP